jgi:predicted aspartyl protease
VTRSNYLPSARRLLSILLAFVALVADAPAASQSRRATPRSTAEFEALPLVRGRKNHLLVRAFINGKQAWLAVDSGAASSFIASHRRKYFSLAAVTPNSNLPLRLRINERFNNVAIVRKLTLGALNLVDQPVVTVDLDDPQIDGILGVDIMLPLAAVLDCQKQLLVLKLDPEVPGHAPGFDYSGFTAIPLQVSPRSKLFVNAAINNVSARLMVDTGAFGTMLHHAFVRQMGIPMQKTRVTATAVNLKDSDVQAARISKLSVGAVDLLNPQVGVTDLEGVIGSGLLEGSPPVVGLLGGEILNRHHGIIDLGTRTLYLKR